MSQPRTLLHDAVLPEDALTGRRTDLHLAAGRIVGIGSAPAGFEAERRIDCRGAIVAPGLIDLSVRLREPGFEYRATLASEMRAAVAGGVTGVCCPPDTDPPLDEPGLIGMLTHRARSLQLARLYPVGALTVGLEGKRLTEMVQLTESGCVGLSQATAPVTDTTLLHNALQYAGTFGYTVWLHPEDPHIGRSGVAHSGPLASRLGLPGIPVLTETLALYTILELVRATGCRVHLCRLSSAAGVELVRRARAEGLPITSDVAVHHLHLTELDIGWFDGRHRVRPPFRSQRDRDALRAGLRDGTIDAICSDHTPVDEDSKLLPYGEAEPGATAVELLLPLLLKWAAEDRIPLATALAHVTTAPARIAGITRPCIEIGARADLCIFAPQEGWQVSEHTLVSQGKDTPYLGYELHGRNHWTLVSGQVVHEAAAPIGGARPAV